MQQVPVFVLILFCITSLICFAHIINKHLFLKNIGIEDLFFIICFLFNIPFMLATISETGGLAISYYTILWSIRLYLIFSYKKIFKEVYKMNYINLIIWFFVLSYVILNIQFVLSCNYTKGFLITKLLLAEK